MYYIPSSSVTASIARTGPNWRIRGPDDSIFVSKSEKENHLQRKTSVKKLSNKNLVLLNKSNLVHSCF